MSELEALEETAGYPDMDPDIITEGDVPPYPGFRVQCEWGYEGCSIDGWSEEFKYQDGGWMCWGCYRTAEAEWEEDHRW